MEEIHVPLNLSQPSSTQTVFNGGISVDNMSWWFWIKAGMGLMIGFMIMGAALALTWTVLIVGGLATLGNIMRH